MASATIKQIYTLLFNFTIESYSFGHSLADVANIIS
jgi:hypothetical protein